MKKINSLLIYVTSVVSLCIFFKDLGHTTIDRLLPSIAMVLVLFIPRILRKIFNLKINNTIELTYLLFVILAQFFGSVINLYNTVFWYDTFAHFLSGLLTTILAVIIMCYLKAYDKKKIIFNAIYLLSFTLMIASLWEFLEFGMDNLLNLNTQHALDTGVDDTMIDMLVAFLGGLIITGLYIYEEKFKKNGFIKKIMKDTN